MNQRLHYKIIYSKRKTIAIELNMDGILVRAPKGMSRHESEAFLKEKQSWIEKHLKKMEEKKEKVSKLQPFSLDEIDALADKALIVIPEKVKRYAPLVGVDYRRITIRSQRTRWGSCSSKGNLNFNFRIMMAPERVCDYVIWHELCHLVHMNHSEAFWKLVSSNCSDYKISRQWLKENVKKLYPI